MFPVQSTFCPFFQKLKITPALSWPESGHSFLVKNPSCKITSPSMVFEEILNKQIIHSENMYTHIKVETCSGFDVLPYPATSLFSTSPPPLSSSPSHHSLHLINPTSCSPLHTEPPLPSVQSATNEPNPKISAFLISTSLILNPSCSMRLVASLVPSSHGLKVASSSIVAYSVQ